MFDVFVRMTAFLFCALIGVPAIVRICLALRTNRDPICRWSVIGTCCSALSTQLYWLNKFGLIDSVEDGMRSLRVVRISLCACAHCFFR